MRSLATMILVPGNHESARAASEALPDPSSAYAAEDSDAGYLDWNINHANIDFSLQLNHHDNSTMLWFPS